MTSSRANWLRTVDATPYASENVSPIFCSERVRMPRKKGAESPLLLTTF